jgi:hypothetical protein
MRKLILIAILFLCTKCVRAQYEYLFKDTLAYSVPVRTHRLSVKRYEKLIAEKKIRLFYPLNDSNTFLIAHQLDTLSYYAIVKRSAKNVLIYDALAGHSNQIDTSWIEMNGKPGKELCIQWSKRETIDNEFSVWQGTRSGMEIWDLNTAHILFQMETSQCGSGWNMCSGKTSSGCGKDIRLQIKGDSILLSSEVHIRRTGELRKKNITEDGVDYYQEEEDYDVMTTYYYRYSEVGLIRFR